MDRRQFVYTSALAGAGACYLTGAACRSTGSQQRLTGKKVLFVYGGWEGHHPQACRNLYVPWLQSEGAEVVEATDLAVYTDNGLMSSLDLIVQVWTMGSIDDQALQGLLSAVQQGTGLAGWHGGVVDAFRDRPAYQFMMGGQFVAHPGGMVAYRVSVTDENDPVMEGIADFSLNTEQYYMHVDPNNQVLATTRFTGDHASWIDGCTMPVVWKRMHGAGRVFVSAIGHNIEDHAVPEARPVRSIRAVKSVEPSSPDWPSMAGRSVLRESTGWWLPEPRWPGSQPAW